MTLLRLLPLFVTRSAFLSAPGLLTVAAFAAPTALLVVVGGGTAAFFRADGELAALYRSLALVAVALLLVPFLSLGAAAARLSARRQDDRLSALSLLGASRGTVTGLALVEPLLLAGSGVVLGAVAAPLLALPLGLVPFRGAPLGWRALLPPAPLLAGLLAGVLVVALGSAAVGVRRLTVGPLAVRLRHEAPRVRARRLLVGGALFSAALIAAVAGQTVAPSVAVMVALSAAAITGGALVLHLVGVWLVGAQARRRVRRAGSPEQLLAARGVLEDPRQAWSQVSGVALTAFTATFVGSGAALVGAGPGGAGTASMTPEEAWLVRDVGTGVLLTLGISFLMVAVSAVVNQAALIHDRRGLYAGLHSLGADTRTLHAARVRTVMQPLLLVAAVSGLAGLVLAAPMAGPAAVLAPGTLALMLGSVAAGALLVRAGLELTRPVLAAVARAPARAAG